MQIGIEGEFNICIKRSGRFISGISGLRSLEKAGVRDNNTTTFLTISYLPGIRKTKNRIKSVVVSIDLTAGQ